MIDDLLKESVFARARRDTWPEGWLKKWVHRVVVAAIALATAYWLGTSEFREGFFTRLETASVGALAVLGADLLFYPWNLLFSPYRQRNELRSFIRSAKEAREDYAELSVSAEWGSGAKRRIAVRNEGTRAVTRIWIEIGDANWVMPEGWKSGAEVIPILRPGEEDSIPFFVLQSIGMRSERVRARITGTCSSDEEVSAEVLLDPHSLC